LLLPPEKTNRSNEAQENYVADMAFASAKLSWFCKKELWQILKKCWEMLCGVLSVLRHSAAPAFSSFSFFFERNSSFSFDMVNMHVSPSKSC
jgi:hypothetical protein